VSIAGTGCSGDLSDAFVTSFTADGQMRWSTCLGGPGDDRAFAVAADQQGNTYITGESDLAGFPVTAGAPQPRIGGGGLDAFVAAFDPGGWLRFSTYLGGSGFDQGAGIATDRAGSIYVWGTTTSHNMPVTPGAAATFFSGRYGNCSTNACDDFMARLIFPASRPAALGPVSPPGAGVVGTRYFPSTHHTLAGPSLAFWDRLGGIPTLGLPLSEPFLMAGQRVQVTERAVLVRSGSQVSLLPLGRLLTEAQPADCRARPRGAGHQDWAVVPGAMVREWTAGAASGGSGSPAARCTHTSGRQKSDSAKCPC
jgi:Beta-propeller repeat